MSDERDGKTRILEAAAEVFANHGFHHASIRAVAKSAGVTNPAIYYHFENKGCLYEAVLQDAFSKFEGRVALALSGITELRAGLLAFAKTITEMVEQNQILGRLVFTSLYPPPSVGQPVDERNRFIHRTLESIQRFIGLHLDEDEGRMHQVAIWFLIMVGGLAQSPLVGSFGMEPNAEERIVDFFLRGIGYVQ